MADPVSHPPQAEAPAAEQDTSAQLGDLMTRAGRSYAAKDYNTASELYSEATELQARLNGEMAAKNAELLYLYGRCLFHVGAGKSEVLGGQDAGTDMNGAASSDKNQEPLASTSGAPPTSIRRKIMDEALSEVMEHKDRAAEEKAPPKKPASNALFQITGDENWDDSEEEEENGDGEGGEDAAGAEAEGDDDELTVAWETLDLARVLFNRQLEELQKDGAADHTSAELRTIKEHLADIHDLLAEISLEHEGYDAAVSDSKASLALKQELYPPESSVIAEAHFKLSLALEFASIKAAPDQAADPENVQVDRAVREEAAQEMEKAIQSAKMRVVKEEAALEAAASGTADSATDPGHVRRSIEEVKEMIAEMEERLNVLKTNTLSEKRSAGVSQQAGGLLDSLLAGSPEERKAKLEEAMKGAMDLSALVRHKKADPAAGAASITAAGDANEEANGADEAGVNANGKRAVDDAAAEEAGEAKRARVETAARAGP